MENTEEKRNSIGYLYRNIKHLCKIDDYDVLNIIIETATEMYEEEISTAYLEGFNDGSFGVTKNQEKYLK
jgi:hypothetical protein